MEKPDSSDTLNKRQFEQLFKSHFAYVCNFAVQYVGDHDTAQDICQKVFITIWEKRSTVSASRAKSYLFTAVKNRCLNYIRDQKKFRSRVLDLDCGDIEIEITEDHEAEAEELKTRIEDALNELPQKCREVFEMSRYRGMKYSEIAKELDIAQKTVEAHMSKALKILRQRLKLIIFLIINMLTVS